MKLIVFNGSPRLESSNTKVLLEHFLKGFMKTEGHSYEVIYLNRLKDSHKFIKYFQEADQVLLAFPLYYDCMPCMVKTFIESLEPLCARKGNPSIGFIVQSGFPEAFHSHAVEQYLEKLARRLGCKYTGTIIKGGAESIRYKPALARGIIYKLFYKLGKSFGKTGEFNETMVDKTARPVKLTGFQLAIWKFTSKIGFYDYLFNKVLKRNNAFHKRFDGLSIKV